MKALGLSIRTASGNGRKTGSRNGVQNTCGLSISLHMNAAAREMISKLGLVPLPGEGGFYKSTWTSAEKFADGRPLGSAILFLITDDDFSALHRLGMDELWHYHAGDAAELTLLDPGLNSVQTLVLGTDVAGNQLAQAVVPARVWQGARISPGQGKEARGWTLFGCTLAPGWDEKEFELGQREALRSEFPAHGALIEALTR
jgi:predicted cupin superfamily sugar epimerase